MVGQVRCERSNPSAIAEQDGQPACSRAEHEMVDQELRAAGEKVASEAGPLGLEAVLLVDPDPGQGLALAGHLVAPAGERLLGLKQVEAGGQPFLAGAGGVGRRLGGGGHESVLLYSVKAVPQAARRRRGAARRAASEANIAT